LVAASLVAVLLNSGTAHELLGASGAAVVATLIALAKARFVASDFTGLRGRCSSDCSTCR
jgi:hypothetical protein